MFSRFNRFLQNVFNRNKTSITIEDIDGIQIFADNQDIRAMDSLAKNFYHDILLTESFYTEFKNVASIKQLVKQPPQFIDVQNNEQLGFRVLIVTEDGFVWHIEAAFKTGEAWSFNRFLKIIHEKMFPNYDKPEGYSNWVNNAYVTDAQYYIRTFQALPE